MKKKKHKFSSMVLPLIMALILAVVLFPLSGCNDGGSFGGQSIDNYGDADNDFMGNPSESKTFTSLT